MKRRFGWHEATFRLAQSDGPAAARRVLGGVSWARRRFPRRVLGPARATQRRGNANPWAGTQFLARARPWALGTQTAHRGAASRGGGGAGGARSFAVSSAVSFAARFAVNFAVSNAMSFAESVAESIAVRFAVGFAGRSTARWAYSRSRERSVGLGAWMYSQPHAYATQTHRQSH